jgi:RHS repeat-associated protein
MSSQTIIGYSDIFVFGNQSSDFTPIIGYSEQFPFSTMLGSSVTGYSELFTFNTIGNNINDGLVAYYPFNGNANDESGNGYHGAIENGPYLVADRFDNQNNAFFFDGIDDYIEILTGIGFSQFNNPQQAYSYSVWFKKTSSACGTLFSNSSEDGWNYIAISDKVYGVIRDNYWDGTGIIGASQVNNDIWHHLVFTFTNPTMRIFVNGQLESTQEFVGNLLSSGGWPAGGVKIGVQYLYDGCYFSGAIDDLRIYNRSLTEDEISYLYSEGNLISLITPGQNTVISTDTIRFSWTPVPGATRYELYVDDSPDLDSPEISKQHINELDTLYTSSYTISGNWLSGNTYFWKVWAILPGDTIKSLTNSFIYAPPLSPQPVWAPLYRAFKPDDVDHFYCSSESHLNRAIEDGYSFEGVEGFVSLHPFEVTSPDILMNIYRFYIPDQTNSKGKGHYYTCDENDKDERIMEGWIYEGISGFGYNQCHTGLTRLYHTYLNQSSPDIRKDNFYTISEIEKNNSIELFNYSPQGYICYVSTMGYESPLLWNENSMEVGYGINPVIGNLGNYSKNIFSIPEGKTGLNFGYLYNSNAVRYFSNSDPLGNGWSHTYNISLSESECSVIVVWPDEINVYEINNESLIPVTPGVYDVLSKVSASEYKLVKKDQTEYTFEKAIATYTEKTFLLTSIKDRFNNVIILQYNDLGWLKYVKSPENRYISFTYYPPNDPEKYGLIHYVKDSLALNRIVTFNYDSLRNLTQFVDAKNNTTIYSYEDGFNPFDHFLKTITYPDGYIITNEFDTVTKRIETQKFNKNGPNVISVSIPSTNQVNVTDETGRNTSFVFDALKNITQLITASGSVNYEFDTVANKTKPTKLTDGKGYITNITYDSRGNPLQIAKPLGITHQYQWNSTNDLTQYTDPRNKITTIAYTNGSPTSIQTPRGTTNMTYYPDGNVHTIVDPLSRTTTMTYDGYHNLNNITDNLSHATHYSYDLASRVTSITNANNQVTSYEYDNNDLMFRVTDANNKATNYTYDVNDRLQSVTDARNHTTGLTYNSVTGLIDHVTDQLSHQAFYNYKDNGLLHTTTNRNNQTLTFDYDDDNRIQTISGPSVNRTFIYDLNDNVTNLNDLNGNLSFTYDSLNRITEYTYMGVNPVQYEYDSADNIKKIIYPGSNKTVEYTYYDDNLLKTVEDWNDNVTHYYYLDDGSLDSIRNDNGTTTKYHYDNAGRLIRLVNRKSDGSIINSYNYTLDNLGNHISVTQNEPINQPAIPAVNETYSYDNANRIIHAGPTTFGFDNSGNMTSKNENGILNYTWDAENRLTGLNGQTTASFVYDGFGNRRAATRNGVTTRYVLDISGSMSNVLIETDAAGNPLYYYIYGLGLISRVKASDNSTNYYHYDSRGSTIAMTDQSQNVTHKYAYDAFGKVLEKEEPISDFNPFRYVGKYGVMYEDSMLYFMRARYYNPKIGRFLSEDPVWDLNLFNYSKNNPILYYDPSGRLSRKTIQNLKYWGKLDPDKLTYAKIMTKSQFRTFGYVSTFIDAADCVKVNYDYYNGKATYGQVLWADTKLIAGTAFPIIGLFMDTAELFREGYNSAIWLNRYYKNK